MTPNAREWHAVASALRLYLVVLLLDVVLWLGDKAAAYALASARDFEGFEASRSAFGAATLLLELLSAAALWRYSQVPEAETRIPARLAFGLATAAAATSAIELAAAAIGAPALVQIAGLLAIVGFVAGIASFLLFISSLMRLSTYFGRIEIRDRLGLVIMLYVLSSASLLVVAILARFRGVPPEVTLIGAVLASAARLWMLLQLSRSLAGTAAAIRDTARAVESFD